MKINRLNLIQDMNKVLPGIATGTMTLENADTVVFTGNHLYSYNSSISVDVVESQSSGLKGVVKGIDFYNCLNKLPGDEIEVEMEEDAWTIFDNSIKVKIKLLPEGKLFERFESLKPTEDWIEIDGEDFHKGLQVCSIAKNSSNYDGVFCKENCFYSTDRFIINKFVAKNNYPTFWINSSAVSELLKWNNFKAIQFNKMWLQFKSADETVFSVRVLNLEKFPIDTVCSIIEKTSSITPVYESEFTEEFYTAVNRAASFSGEDEGHEFICLNIGSEGSTITSERNSGAYEEKILSIKSDTSDELKLDVQILQECSSYFNKFKVISRGEIKNLLLEVDSALKIVPTIA